MPDLVYAALAALLAITMIVIIVRIVSQTRVQRHLAAHFGELIEQLLEQKHRAMLNDLHNGLAQQSDRLTSRLATELTQTRETLHRFQLSLASSLDDTTERINARIDRRLDQIAGKVNERLEEGARKTNENVLSMLRRIAALEEAQKKAEALTAGVAALQEVLGNKRARGAPAEARENADPGQTTAARAGEEGRK